ncbi:hypothetical protein V8E54_008595 [Elaphomyces granulatus]|jgi:syntaxin 5
MLQGNVGANFKDVLEVQTKNIQASRLRTGALATFDPGQSAPQSDQQLLLLEEAQPNNTYIQEAIERTINELGGIFGQLAEMVSEQSEMIQRIDANGGCNVRRDLSFSPSPPFFSLIIFVSFPCLLSS